jgi:hypothetical protein
MKIDLGLIGIGIAGYFLFLKPKAKSTITWNTSSDTNVVRKFPGYQIQNQIIYISDSNKAKKYVFDIGKTKPEGSLFKSAFGTDNISYSDVKIEEYSNTTNFIVKDKKEQDKVYILLTYLFSGAYQQFPHRAGHFADLINEYVTYLKNMFNVDYPVLKSVEQAKAFFEEMGKTV